VPDYLPFVQIAAKADLLGRAWDRADDKMFEAGSVIQLTDVFLSAPWD